MTDITDEAPVDDAASYNMLTGCFTAIGAVLLAILGSVAAMVAGIWLLFTFSPFSSLGSMPIYEATGRVALAIMNDVGEEPAVAPVRPAPYYPIDARVPEALAAPLRQAFDLMRGTPDGERLFELLVEYDVLISVEPIDFNAGYTSTRWNRNGWVSSRIVIDDKAVRTSKVDVLAAILVHEAAHVDRAVNGTACFYQRRCEELPNGVQIEEEIYAHGVETAWWQTIYGSDGKRFAFGAATGMNALLDAWRDGEAAFEAFVREMRSDDREGGGI